jgi:hypothetical protein
LLRPAHPNVVQWDKDDPERLGLLKIDVLALVVRQAPIERRRALLAA